MNIVYLILGSNKGDRDLNLLKAQGLLTEKVGLIAKKSDIYVTAPWGNPNQADFYNQAIELETVLTARQLLVSILEIEKELGRIRSEEKWTERTMDIDIAFFNQDCFEQTDLVVPHRQLQKRKFVLVPLNQIASEYIHPILNKSINELLAECEDSLIVKKLQHP